jgi:UDP-4-amino-4,6-dideoxy-N-acetyl-beta-L-altrosamine N-acetyltransferase
MLNLRPLTLDDAPMILEWRNSDAVAPFMFRSDPIPYDEHQIWFSKVLSDSDTAIYRIMEKSDVPVGFVSISEIDEKRKTCEWGGYLAPSVPRGSGLGKALLYMSANVAFEKFQLDEIVVEVIISNDVAKRLYESIGFEIQKTIVKTTSDSPRPVSAIVMNLERSTWQATRGQVEKDLGDLGLIV